MDERDELSHKCLPAKTFDKNFSTELETSAIESNQMSNETRISLGETIKL
jgi:hypothetical protein